MDWVKRIIFVAVLLAAGLTFYFGYWNFRDVERGAKQGLKEVKEATGMKPNVVQDKGHAEQCRQNLKLLESIKRQIAEERGTVSVSWEEIRKRCKNGVLPTCPDGGEYQLNGTGQPVSCSIGNNNTMDRSDDHHIAGF